MRVEERLERGVAPLGNARAHGCIGVHTLDPLWQMDVEEEDEVKGTIVRLNAMVRGCYLNHLRRVLMKNCELCSPGSGFVFSPHDIEKCTAQLEMLALRSCMVSGIYQRAMNEMTADIKKNTEELKLYEKLKELVRQKCTCLMKESKETQTDSVIETPIIIKTEPMTEQNVTEVHVPNPVVFPETPNPEPGNCESQAMPIPVYVSGMTTAPSNLDLISSSIDTQDHENFFNSDTASLWFGSSSSYLFGSKISGINMKEASNQKNGLCSVRNGVDSVKTVVRLQDSVCKKSNKVQCVTITRQAVSGGESPCDRRVVKRLRLNGNDPKINLVTSGTKTVSDLGTSGSVSQGTAEEESVLGIRKLENSVCKSNICKGPDVAALHKSPPVKRILGEIERESGESNDSGAQHLLRILESEGEENDGGDETMTDMQNILSSRSQQRYKTKVHKKCNEGSVPSTIDTDNSVVPDNSEPDIWTMQKYIHQRLLHDKISRTCCDPEKKSEIVSRFNELFGYDSDEEEVWCSEEQITRYRRRIASWVVERLLPYYREKRLHSRLIFKTVAKEITNKLICVNHYPSECDVEKGVLLFFSYHGVVETESDIWKGWGKTLT